MSPANHYKKVENKIVEIVLRKLKALSHSIAAFIKSFISLGRQRFTVMFIPHSEKNIFNFRISIFSVVFLSMLFCGVLVAFFTFSTQFTGISRLLSEKSTKLEGSEESLNIFLDRIADLKKKARIFESALSKTTRSLDLKDDPQGAASVADGDLSAFFGVEEHEEGVLPEIGDLESISVFLSESVRDLEKIASLIKSHGDLLIEMPTLWPVEGGVGYITNPWGPAVHPFTNKWYMHKGIDIAKGYGFNILAAADGKVVEASNDRGGFGNYIIIMHNFGFYTKYAHLGNMYVSEGDTVIQGQRIGTMGSSGLSTGPHLHYEIRIGSQVVDPARFLNVQKGLE